MTKGMIVLSKKIRSHQKKTFKRITVSFCEKTYNELCGLAKEFGMSLSAVTRIALEENLRIYFGKVRYIDGEQAEEIRKATLDILDNCRKIYNEMNRIGVNYNQEIRLKNAEAKWNKIAVEKYISAEKKYEAHMEYEAVKSDVAANIYFSKEEVFKLLYEYKSVTETIKELVCRIPQ